MEKLISILLLSAILFLFAGCTAAYQSKPNSYIPEAVPADLSGYTNLENSDGFMEVTPDTVIASIGNKEITAYVFLGSTNCHYCQSAIVEVQKQAVQNKETIYYLSIVRIESEEQYNQLVEVLAPILKTDNEGNPTVFMPHLFVIDEGELVDGHLGFGEGYDYSDVFNKTLQEGK